VCIKHGLSAACSRERYWNTHCPAVGPTCFELLLFQSWASSAHDSTVPLHQLTRLHFGPRPRLCCPSGCTSAHQTPSKQFASIWGKQQSFLQVMLSNNSSCQTFLYAGHRLWHLEHITQPHVAMQQPGVQGLWAARTASHMAQEGWDVKLSFIRMLCWALFRHSAGGTLVKKDSKSAFSFAVRFQVSFTKHGSTHTQPCR